MKGWDRLLYQMKVTLTNAFKIIESEKMSIFNRMDGKQWWREFYVIFVFELFIF